MNDYLGKLLKWAAEKKSRSVDVNIRDGKISKVFIYDFLLNEGDHLLEEDGTLIDPDSVDLDGMARQAELKKFMALKEKYGDAV